MGLPTAHLCSIVPISRTVGANRIVPTVAIPHPLGDPGLDPEAERALRRNLVEQALRALAADVDAQTVFDQDAGG